MSVEPVAEDSRNSKSFVDQDKDSLKIQKVDSSKRSNSIKDKKEDEEVIIHEVDEESIESKPEESDEEEERENMNVRAAIVHMIGDMVQSIGVIVAAVIIYVKPEWKIADPICTFLFSILVMITTIPIFIDCMRILMESSPTDIEVLDVFNAIQDVSTLKVCQ